MADSDRYQCFAWLVQEVDGTEGVIATILPEMGNMISNLQNAKRPIAEKLARYAFMHSEHSGRPVRMVRLLEVPLDG